MMPQCSGNGTLHTQLCVSDTLVSQDNVLAIDFILFPCRPLIFTVGLYSTLFTTLKLRVKKGVRMGCFLKSTETKE